MHLTPDILEAAYDYLRSTPPFSKWRLPTSEEVVFHVAASKEWKGDYCYVTNPAWPRGFGQHTIRISVGCVDHTTSLMEAMAHEMIHLRQQLIGDKSHHGRRFQAMAKAVCKQHGFDPKLF